LRPRRLRRRLAGVGARDPLCRLGRGCRPRGRRRERGGAAETLPGQRAPLLPHVRPAANPHSARIGMASQEPRFHMTEGSENRRRRTMSGPAKPDVRGFFDEPTNTVSYLVSDPATRAAAVIDPVLDYDQATGKAVVKSADAILAAAREAGLTIVWVLETHAHADHLSAA